MKTILLSATLIALLGSAAPAAFAATAATRNATAYMKVDCMDRDGGPSGCSSPSFNFYGPYGYGASRSSYYYGRSYDAPYAVGAPAFYSY